MTRMEVSPIQVRFATQQDIEALVILEEACFSAPWSRKSFEAELQGNQFSQLLVVADPKGLSEEIPLVAYICAWLVFEEVRFLNLAVRQDFRRQGIGKRLIAEMLTLASGEGCLRGFLEVRESNKSAKNLYHSFNFQEYGTRKSYYTNPLEDAILMIQEPVVNPFEGAVKGAGSTEKR